MPMLVPAPGRLSTTTLCPITSPIAGPMTRATRSRMAPGADGTTMRTGRLGKSRTCAQAKALARPHATTAKHLQAVFIDNLWRALVYRVSRRECAVRSLFLGARRFHRFAPLHDFGVDDLRSLFGRVADRHRTVAREAL